MRSNRVRHAEIRGLEPDRTAAPSRLALYLSLAYTLAIVYASLTPFTGWRDPGTDPFDFIGAPWPRFVTRFDILINVLAYLPFGFLVTISLLGRLRTLPAAVLAALMSALLSCLLEVLQAYLPARIPSNIDFAANTVGGVVGAVLAARAGADRKSHV